MNNFVPEIINLEFMRGDDLRDQDGRAIVFKKNASRNPQAWPNGSLVGALAKLSLVYGGQAIAAFDGACDDVDGGRVVFELSNAQTENIATGTFQYDVQITMPAPPRNFTIARGACRIFADASRGFNTPAIVAPAAPSALTVQALSSITLRLNWQDNASNEDGFKIDRDDGAGFVEIATVGAGVIQYDDIGLAPASSHTYRVRAYNGGGNSAYSNTASGVTDSGAFAAFNEYLFFSDQGYAAGTKTGAQDFSVEAVRALPWSYAPAIAAFGPYIVPPPTGGDLPWPPDAPLNPAVGAAENFELVIDVSAQIAAFVAASAAIPLGTDHGINFGVYIAEQDPYNPAFAQIAAFVLYQLTRNNAGAINLNRLAIIGDPVEVGMSGPIAVSNVGMTVADVSARLRFTHEEGVCTIEQWNGAAYSTIISASRNFSVQSGFAPLFLAVANCDPGAELLASAAVVSNSHLASFTKTALQIAPPSPMLTPSIDMIAEDMFGTVQIMGSTLNTNHGGVLLERSSDGGVTWELIDKNTTAGVQNFGFSNYIGAFAPGTEIRYRLVNVNAAGREQSPESTIFKA